MKVVTKFPPSPVNYERVIKINPNSAPLWVYEFDGFFWKSLRLATTEEIIEGYKSSSVEDLKI